MEKETVRTLELAPNVKMTITVELWHFHWEGDVWEGTIGENSWSYKTKFELDFNGKKYHDNNGMSDYTNEVAYPQIRKEKMKIPAEVAAMIFFVAGPKDEAKQLQFRMPTRNKIVALIDEAKEELATEESRAYFDKVAKAESAKKEAEKAAEIEKHKKTIEEFEGYLARGEKVLETVKEREQWVKNYINFMNEGDKDGFVPKPPVCRENYEYAKKKLAELTK